MPVHILSRTLVDMLVGLVVVPAQPAQSSPLLFEGFESYTASASPLDKNTSGPNNAPNGSGNPWFGPLPPNARVVGPENGIFPHSGSKMIRGSSPAEFDQNWLNLAYRLNGGAPFTGGIELDWWFYDKNGPGDGNFRDYVALAFYSGAPSNTDYPSGASLSPPVSINVQRLSLGASLPAASPLTDTSKYQARIMGATSGVGFIAGTSGWFNLPVGRSPGWHHAKIVVGPALPDNTNVVGFYIDDMNTPVLVHNSMTAWGYNVIEVNTDFGSQTAYFDDFNFDLATPPPPTGACCNQLSCTIQTEAACVAASGNYEGNDTTCANGTCCHAPRFDIDGDGDVDLNDFGAMQRCMGGPATGYCRCFDKDENGAMGAADFAAFRLCAPVGDSWCRAGVPAPINCND